MAKDNDAYVRSMSSSSVKASPSSASNSDNEEDAESPSREEDVAAFDRVFAQFDPNNLGVVSMRDFLSIIDELDHLRPRSSKPLLTEVQREQSQAFSSSEGGTAEMTRSQLFEFIKEMTGNKIIIASPKKKSVPRKEQASPTKSDVSRGKGSMLPGISARSQVRPQHKKRRGDLEKMADGTTNVIAEHEEFSAVRISSDFKCDIRFLFNLIFLKDYHPSTLQDGMLLSLESPPQHQCPFPDGLPLQQTNSKESALAP